MAENEPYRMSDEEYERTKKLALLGDEEAMVRMGNAFLCGWRDGNVDVKTAGECYRRAAEKGYPKGMREYGEFLFARSDELGMDRDLALTESHKFTGMAAEAGCEDAYFLYALNFRYGNGCEADPSKAIEWFEKYKETTKGSIMCVNPLSVLAEMYERGEGCDPDTDKAKACRDEIDRLEASYKERRKKLEDVSADDFDESPYEEMPVDKKKPVTGKKTYRPVQKNEGPEDGKNGRGGK